MILEDIRIQIKIINDKVKEKIKGTQDQMKKLNEQVYKQNMEMRKMTGSQKAATAQMTSFREQTYGFGRVMGMSLDRFKNFNQQGYKFNSMGGRMANGLRKMTHGMRGFKMEMLGVMFFGMSLTRVFSGLVGKSLEWYGVMDVFSSALGLLFLPVAEKLLDWALRFLDWVGNLTEEQKKLIGTIIMIVGAFGIFLTIVGTLALGIGSIIQAFGGVFMLGPALSAMAAAAGTTIGALIAPILLIAAIIAVVIVGMVIAWKKNFMNMKTILEWFISGFMDLFGGIITFFKGVLQIIQGIFSGDWSKILEGLTNMFLGFMQALWGLFKILVNGAAAILIGIIQIVWNIVKLILVPLKWLFTLILKRTGDVGRAILEFFRSIPGAIKSFFSGIAQWIAKTISNIIPNWMLKLLRGGSSMFSGIKSRISGIFGFAEGGVVPGPKGAPMPAIVHGGERIIPDGGSTGGSVNQTITINANISNDYDVRKLADQLNRYWVSDINKMTKSK